jgi:hypothetical protein
MSSGTFPALLGQPVDVAIDLLALLVSNPSASVVLLVKPASSAPQAAERSVPPGCSVNISLLCLQSVLGFDLTTAGLAATYPWLCMAIMANVGGWIADTLVARGVNRTLVRKVMQTIGFMGPAFFLSQLRLVTDGMTAVLCMCACQGLDAFSQSGLYSNHQVRPCVHIAGR